MSKASGAVSASVELTATVLKIDAKDSWVTLQLADGTTFDVHAGPAVKNFAQIKVGDPARLRAANRWAWRWIC
jgi:hypothetical protein